MSPPGRYSQHGEESDGQSDPPPKHEDLRIEIDRVKFRLKQLEHDFGELEKTVDKLGGDQGDSKVKIVGVQEYITRVQSDAEKRAGMLRAVFGTIAGGTILAALIAIGKMLWEALKK